MNISETRHAEYKSTELLTFAHVFNLVVEVPPGEEERLGLGGEDLHQLKLGEPLPSDPAVYLLIFNIVG